MSGRGPGYPHHVMCALSNKPKRGGATRPRPEMVFVGEKVWGFLRWMGQFRPPVTEQFR